METDADAGEGRGANEPGQSSEPSQAEAGEDSPVMRRPGSVMKRPAAAAGGPLKRPASSSSSSQKVNMGFYKRDGVHGLKLNGKQVVLATRL